MMRKSATTATSQANTQYFKKIPIFFHNLKNYDAHLIIARANELNIKLNQNKKIDVIAQNSEKFITFSFGACQFKDSFAFLTASLDKLVRLNKYEGNQKIKDWETRFRYTSTNPYIKSKTDLNLLTDKGVYKEFSCDPGFLLDLGFHYCMCIVLYLYTWYRKLPRLHALTVSYLPHN